MSNLMANNSFDMFRNLPLGTKVRSLKNPEFGKGVITVVLGVNQYGITFENFGMVVTMAGVVMTDRGKYRATLTLDQA